MCSVEICKDLNYFVVDLSMLYSRCELMCIEDPGNQFPTNILTLISQVKPICPLFKQVSGTCKHNYPC